MGQLGREKFNVHLIFAQEIKCMYAKDWFSKNESKCNSVHITEGGSVSILNLLKSFSYCSGTQLKDKHFQAMFSFSCVPEHYDFDRFW